ncbi:MAG: hypothetical protein HKP07_01925, partial [Flavobacteriaceae bacterium]|nr:hypothetical protein [Flavobacteriaceae bacterium]
MSLKSVAARIFAGIIFKRTQKWVENPIKTQKKVFNDLIKEAKKTKFGLDHEFETIRNHSDFVQKVPIRDYEALKGYVEQVVAGQEDILWPGKPTYFAKTSGTTSGAKFIPITKASIE